LAVCELLGIARENALAGMTEATPDPGALEILGFIVPGLLAHEMDRQGCVRTLLFLLLISAIVRFVLYVVKGWLFI
jgi:hypothetical protein